LFQIRVADPAPQPELERVQQLLSQVPGTVAVGGVSDWWFSTLIVPKTLVRIDSAPTARSLEACSLIVTPGFFAAIGAPLVSGREFTTNDVNTAPWSIVVNQEAARLIWPHESPLGLTLTLGNPDERPRVVVGIARNMPLHREDLGVKPMIFTSSIQQPPYRRPPIGEGRAGRMTFAVRYRANGSGIAREAQRRIGAIGLSLPLVSMGEADDLGMLLLEFRRYCAALNGLALVAIGLTLVGLHGVTAHAVTERTRDIAVRMAVGARRLQVLRVVGSEVLTIVAIGVAAGCAGTAVLPRLIASKLWGVDSSYALTTMAVSTVVVATVAAAVWLPLRRAVRIDPAVALRMDG
jgi:hypothetical protein